MDIACRQCRTRFKIPDEKLPRGKVLSVPCPRCRNKITIDTRKNTGPAGISLIDEVASGSYDASEKPFDFIEEGAKTALLSEPDPDKRIRLKSVIEALGYHATEPASAKEALKQMRFHVFDLVVLNEAFDTPPGEKNPLLDYLSQIPMSMRRNIFVVLLTTRHRTMDNMAAFNNSVNLTVNMKNIDDFEKIIRSGLADYHATYRVFKVALEKLGLV